jgi:predicted phosphodiesterase
MTSLINPDGFLDGMFAQIEGEGDGWKAKRYGGYFTITSEHILVASDVHFPKYDEKLFKGMLSQAWREEIDTIVWAGDFYDMEEWSTYGIDDPTSSFQRNLRNGGKIMRGVAGMGFKQIWSRGNHEERVFRNRPINMEMLANLSGLTDLLESGQLVVSDHPMVYASVGNWVIVHPAQYGSFPGVVASKLATRYQANTVVAHEHHWGMTTDETGQFVAISSGGLFDPKLHKYIQYNVTSHRAWQQGFVTIHEGQAQLYRGKAALTIQKEFARVR